MSIPTDFTDSTNITAGRVTLTVGTYADDRGQRRPWHYYITVGNTIVHVGNDLESGGSADEALETFASFLGAWADSVAYMERNGREGENIHLFPLWLYETVGPEVEDLYALASDRVEFHA